MRRHDRQITPHDRVVCVERVCIGAEFKRDPDSGDLYAVRIYRVRSEHIAGRIHANCYLRKSPTTLTDKNYHARGRMPTRTMKRGKA